MEPISTLATPGAPYPILKGAGQGSVFFVDSNGGGSTTSGGLTPESAFTTLNAAIGACTASKGDTICVMPGHVETITGAAGVLVNKAGVRIVGLGTGRNRPRINYTTAIGASFDITADNVSVENIYFTPQGFDAITATMNISGANVSIRNCEFDLAGATNQAVLGILTASGANRLLVEDCFFHGTADAGTATAIRVAAGDDVVIRDNIFHGAYTTSLGAIDNSAAVKDLQIYRNKINNLTASSTKGIVCHASSTGQISQNFIQILSGTAPITGAAMSWVGGNYYSATIATAGTLI